MLALYVHIPFCVRKCRYCDFLSAPASQETIQLYTHALTVEAKCSPLAGREVGTVFFGGGTPSLLSARQMESLMGALREYFHIDKNAEISMEMNPGTADMEKLYAYRAAGINRLSIGVQSFLDKELYLLGRIHTAEEAENAYKIARRVGFDNINLDLMSALPGQTCDEWLQNLDHAARLEPEHISAYSLIIEDGTPFSVMKLPPLPDEESDRRMYHDTLYFLEERGFHRYEISNYAMKSRECRHNLTYWTGGEYLGLGIGAASLIRRSDGRWIRFANTDSLREYLNCTEDGAPDTDRSAKERKKCLQPAEKENDSGLSAISWRIPHKEESVLTLQDEMEEFMFLGLRLIKGVSTQVFARRFGRSLQSVYEQPLKKHLLNGLLQKKGERIALTERGLDLANYVMSDFILDT